MIAACPKCQTRYRLRPEQLGERGVRLRCRRCEALFRVLPPSGVEAPSPPTPQPAAPPEPRVREPAATPPETAVGESVQGPPASEPAEAPAADSTPETPFRKGAAERPEPFAAPALVVAHRDAREAKQLADAFSIGGQVAMAADDGVQALLSIHRTPPRAVIADAALPGLSGHALCEVIKRTESLREIPVVLLHDASTAARDPRAEGFGADLYLDIETIDGALSEALHEALAAWGIRTPTPTPAERDVQPAPTDPVAAPEPKDGDDPPKQTEEFARAERLARIAVSDIILYNEEKFAAALRSSDPLQAMRDEVEEGRALLRGRIADEVFARRDFVGEELLRVAGERA